MEKLKKCVHQLLEAKDNHVTFLQQINEVVLKNYYLSIGGYLTIVPKDLEIYYVNRKAVAPFIDSNMQCLMDPKMQNELWALQSNRFGQLYFHIKGMGGIDICLSDSSDYALCCTIKAAEVNGEEYWSTLKVRNRVMEIISQQEGLDGKEAVSEWVNRIHSLPVLYRKEISTEGDVYHLRRKGMRRRDKHVNQPLRSLMDLWNKKLNINHVQKLLMYMNHHPEINVLDVLRAHQFRYIPMEIRIRYKIEKHVKLYE